MRLLSINNASKSYAGVPALKAASLELVRGEVHALMGENGAGKSTLIKILAGVVSPDSVEIKLKNELIHIGRVADAFNHGFRFIHQELNIVPQLSVAENVFLGQNYPRRFGLLIDWPSLNRAATATLAKLGIEHINPKQKIASLSTGDQMLVKIAGALLSEDGREAVLYVMDEPTAALTGEESERLFKVIEELKAKGCTVLYISHRMDEVLRICDRVTVMRDGERKDTRYTSDIAKQEIIKLMTGRDMVQAFPAAKKPAGEKVVLDVRKLSGNSIGNISFKVHEGEILGVAGLAGSGQSELLRMLMGADAQREWDVRLDGEKQGKLNPAQAWSHKLAYVPQERRSQGLVLTRSIRDNVTLPHLKTMSYAGIFLNRGREDQYTLRLGRQVRLKAVGTTQLCYQLSGGNQQKVVFARAIANTPRLLLLDEPTRGVDVGAKYDIYTLIRELSASGAAVILGSSDLSELLGMCDRILVMVEQSLSADVQASDLTQESLLSLCFGGSDQ